MEFRKGWNHMQPRRYCVYNQASECFLSLGVTLGRAAMARLLGILRKPSQRPYEGSWILGRGPFYTGFFSILDLVYLDEAHKVVHVIEAYTGVGFAPRRKDAASVLILPVRTILTSQTQPGNQLVICAAKEMESRLRPMPRAAAAPAPDPEAFVSWLSKEAETERRGATRKRWPRLVACDVSGSTLPVHGVRDISATGLYLITPERWPVGTQLKLSLQRTDEAGPDFARPITVEMRVTRWGADGLGMEFLKSDTEHSARLVMHAH